MIRSFRCRETERISLGGVSRDFPPDIQTRARNKLVFLDKARDLDDLRQTPGHRLEALKGDRAGQWSIRISDQWPGALWAMLRVVRWRGRRGDRRLSLARRDEEESRMLSRRRHTFRDGEVFEHGRLPKVHPGDILREEFLEPLGLTAYQLAKAIGVEQTRVSEILHGKRGISADTALRLSRFFGTSAELWMGLQSQYELEEAGEGLRETLETIRPREPAAA